jgi:hypothetical protein
LWITVPVCSKQILGFSMLVILHSDLTNSEAVMLVWRTILTCALLQLARDNRKLTSDTYLTHNSILLLTLNFLILHY